MKLMILKIEGVLNDYNFETDHEDKQKLWALHPDRVELLNQILDSDHSLKLAVSGLWRENLAPQPLLACLCAAGVNIYRDGQCLVAGAIQPSYDTIGQQILNYIDRAERFLNDEGKELEEWICLDEDATDQEDEGFYFPLNKKVDVSKGLNEKVRDEILKRLTEKVEA